MWLTLALTWLLVHRQVLVDERGLPHGVKLSDLGSAHSLTDRDYYRKLGAAELPVRWMPPEALRAGIFTAQGDVWSFGVLAFEVFFLAGGKKNKEKKTKSKVYGEIGGSSLFL